MAVRSDRASEFTELKWTLREGAAVKELGTNTMKSRTVEGLLWHQWALPAFAAAELFLACRGKGQSIRKEKIALIQSSRIWNAFAVTPSEQDMLSKYSGGQNRASNLYPSGNVRVIQKYHPHPLGTMYSLWDLDRIPQENYEFYVRWRTPILKKPTELSV